MQQQYSIPFSKMLGGQDVASKAREVRNRLIKKVGLFVLVAVVCSLFCVWSRVKVVQVGYEVSELQKESEDLMKTESHLKIEVGRLKSPSHLQKVATTILKMRPPTGEDTVFVKKENAVVVSGAVDDQ